MMIVGLDLSLTNLGMVAVPPSWDLEYRRVGYQTLSTKPGGDHLDRILRLADDVGKWCARVGAREIWAEDIAASQGYSVVALSELRALVRLRVREHTGIDVLFVGEVKARKLLLGWFPRDKKRKAVVSEILKASGYPFQDEHQRDAFAVANFALHEAGAPCLVSLLGPKPELPKAKRKSKRGANGRALPRMVIT